MGWGDLLQILVIVTFWSLCDCAAPESHRKRWALLLSGLILMIIGTHNGFVAGQDKAARDAQQARILSSPEMPR